MRNWRSRLRIGLSVEGVAVLRTSGLWRRNTSIVADQNMDADLADKPEQCAQRLSSILKDAQCTGMPAEIVIDDKWARLFIVTPPANASRFQDCRAAAQMRFNELYGEVGNTTDWLISADWHAIRPFLACAIPKVLVDCIQSSLQQQRCHLMSMTPHFITSLNRWHTAFNGDAWFGVVHDNNLALGVMAQGNWCAVRSVAIPDNKLEHAWLQTHVTREALRLNVQTPAQIQICGNQRALSAAALKASSTTGMTIVNLEGTAQTSKQSGVLTPAMALARTGMRWG